MHDKFYVIHKISNPKGMVSGDGAFTEGMIFVIFSPCIPPQFQPCVCIYICKIRLNNVSFNINLYLSEFSLFSPVLVHGFPYLVFFLSLFS